MLKEWVCKSSADKAQDMFVRRCRPQSLCKRLSCLLYMGIYIHSISYGYCVFHPAIPCVSLVLYMDTHTLLLAFVIKGQVRHLYIVLTMGDWPGMSINC